MCTCAFDQGLYCPCTKSKDTPDYIHEQRMPFSHCTDAQADLGHRFSHILSPYCAWYLNNKELSQPVNHYRLTRWVFADVTYLPYIYPKYLDSYARANSVDPDQMLSAASDQSDSSVHFQIQH